MLLLTFSKLFKLTLTTFMKLAELAEKTFAQLSNKATRIRRLSARRAWILPKTDEITFLANPKYTPQIQDTKASAIFLNENAKIEREDFAILRAKDPYLSYTRALRLFYPGQKFHGFIHPSGFY